MALINALEDSCLKKPLRYIVASVVIRQVGNVCLEESLALQWDDSFGEGQSCCPETPDTFKLLNGKVKSEYSRQKGWICYLGRGLQVVDNITEFGVYRNSGENKAKEKNKHDPGLLRYIKDSR